MQTIHIRQWFRARPEEIFERFCHHDGLGDIWPGRIRRIHPGLDQPDGVGSVREVKLPGLRFREQVTEYRPPALIAYHLVSGLPLVTHHFAVMRFRGEGVGTILDYRIELDARFMAAPLIAQVMEEALKPGIRRLAARYE